MRRVAARLLLAHTLWAAACGGGTGDDDALADGGLVGGGDGGDGLFDGGLPGRPADDLSTAAGCDGIFNPDQVLRFELTMSGGDWSALKADTTSSVYYPAQLRCGDEGAVMVGVRRKRSGGTDKPGLKIDINLYVPGQFWHGLKKLSLENGISEGSGSAGVQDVMAEYLAWRIMERAGVIAGRATFVELTVNGAAIGTYTNVEVVDKRFLRSRLGGDDSGWLFKRSGSPEDGYKTNELQANPYEADFCFFDKTASCPLPADLETWLPAHLDIPQMLRLGGANALMANADSPLGKDNNYYFYDRAVGRVYFPWDLDSTMKNTDMAFFRPAVPGGVTFYWDALAPWEGDHDTLWTELLAGPLALAVIESEIDRAVSVAGAALEADPSLGGSAAAAGEALKSWWAARHAAVTSELAAH
jgi:hypothetical protein